MDRRRDLGGFAWPSFLIQHTANGTISVHHQRKRERGGGFPVELGESNKRVVRNYSTPSPRIYTSTVPRQGAEDIPRNNVPRNVPVHHRLHRSSSSSETQLKITSVSHRIPNFSYTEFHPLDIHHSLGNLGSRDLGELLLHTNRYIRYFLLLPGIF